MSTGIRRIRSESTDQRRTSHSVAPQSPSPHVQTSAAPAVPRPYDVDEVTSLDRHRRLSTMEQELRRSRREHSEARQHLEGIIRELLDKQRRLSEQLVQQRHEAQGLRNEMDARDAALAAARQQAMRSEEDAIARAQRAEQAAVEAHEELSEALEKLKKADHYIRLLSDEAASRQMEVEHLCAQLEEHKTLQKLKDEADQQAKARRRVEEVNEDEKEKEKKEHRLRAAESGEALARVVELVLSCADGCDAVSRECEELIDVIREQQQQQQQQRAQQKEKEKHEGQSGLDGRYRTDELIESHAWEVKAAPALVSCKPSEAELARLFSIARGPGPGPGHRHARGSEPNPDRISALEAIASRLLHGMSTALHAVRDDVLIASRAYAELARTGRDHDVYAASLRATLSETRASLASAVARHEALSSELATATSARGALRTALDEAETVMTEAAALATEHTDRTDALLRDNATLEASVAAHRRSLRERDEALTMAERAAREANEKAMHLAQSAARLEEALREAQRCAARAAEEREAMATELRNAVERHRAEAEAAQRGDVERVFAQKHVEDLQAQLEQTQRERQALRDARDTAERERRQALVKLDAAMRRPAPMTPCAEPIAPLPMHSQSNAPSVSPSGVVERGDKVRWWEERLGALTAQVRQDDGRVVSAAENRLSDDWGGRAERQSAALAALAYGMPTNSGGEPQ